MLGRADKRGMSVYTLSSSIWNTRHSGDAWRKTRRIATTFFHGTELFKQQNELLLFCV